MQIFIYFPGQKELHSLSSRFEEIGVEVSAETAADQLLRPAGKVDPEGRSRKTMLSLGPNWTI